MEASDIRAKVIEINAQIRKSPWMDFEVIRYEHQELMVVGNLSQTYPDRPGQIEVLFKDIYFVTLPFSWKTDTSMQVFSLLEGPEAVSVSKLFQVEQGYHVFKFKPEYYEEGFGCLIGAKELSYRVL